MNAYLLDDRITRAEALTWEAERAASAGRHALALGWWAAAGELFGMVAQATPATHPRTRARLFEAAEACAGRAAALRALLN